MVSDAELAAVVADLGGEVPPPELELGAMVQLPGSAAPVSLGVGPSR
jgi:hypothetical protein